MIILIMRKIPLLLVRFVFLIQNTSSYSSKLFLWNFAICMCICMHHGQFKQKENPLGNITLSVFGRQNIQVKGAYIFVKLERHTLLPHELHSNHLLLWAHLHMSYEGDIGILSIRYYVCLKKCISSATKVRSKVVRKIFSKTLFQA